MITDPGLIAKINEVNSNSAATGISLSRESSEGEIYINDGQALFKFNRQNNTTGI